MQIDTFYISTRTPIYVLQGIYLDAWEGENILCNYEHNKHTNQAVGIPLSGLQSEGDDTLYQMRKSLLDST